MATSISISGFLHSLVVGLFLLSLLPSGTLGQTQQESLVTANPSSKFARKGHIGVHASAPSIGALERGAYGPKDAEGPLLGYLACHKLVPTKKDAVLYGFNLRSPVMEITALATNERMAVAPGQLGNFLGPMSKSFHFPRHTRSSSAAGVGPQHDPEQAMLYETTVFSYNPDNEEIQVQWANPDGNYVDVEIALFKGRLYYTGDIHEYRKYLNTGGGGVKAGDHVEVEHVTYKWYPLVNRT